MAFFEIKDPNFNADEIEKLILKSLAKRGIPLEEEKDHLQKVDLLAIKKSYYAQVIIRLKLLFNRLPKWLIRIFKLFPFYKIIRKRLFLLR